MSQNSELTIEDFQVWIDSKIDDAEEHWDKDDPDYAEGFMIALRMVKEKLKSVGKQ